MSNNDDKNKHNDKDKVEGVEGVAPEVRLCIGMAGPHGTSMVVGMLIERPLIDEELRPYVALIPSEAYALARALIETASMVVLQQIQQEAQAEGERN